MKKILLILILTVISLQAKPCMTDIYFGNGVWNTEKDAIYSKRALRNFMLYRANIRLDINKEGIDYNFKHAYNPSYGTIDDLIETYWQLKESGQISEGYFGAVYAALTWEESGEFYNKLDDVIQHYNQDVATMFTIYQEASFKNKHNVLLVAHSQGNLWGNKIYTLLSDAQKQKFRMVSVATPADHVAGGGPYVTAVGDYVIGPIDGSLPGNVDGTGHTFIGTYLNASINAPRKIALYVKAAYNNLMQTTSCQEYNFTVVTMPTFGVLNVYGNIDYTKDELVGTVTLEKRKAVWNDDEQKYSCPLEDSFYWGGGNYFGDNWTTYKDDKDNNWIPGQYITSRTYLDNVSDTTDTVRKESQCVTISLNKGGDLYDMIYDMFPE